MIRVFVFAAIIIGLLWIGWQNYTEEKLRRAALSNSIERDAELEPIGATGDEIDIIPNAPENDIDTPSIETQQNEPSQHL